MRARERWNQQREREIREDERKRVKMEAEQAKLDRERLKIAEQWQRKKNKAVKKYENFVQSEQEVLSIIHDYGAVEMQECILESDIGPDLVDYLGKNYDECERIAQYPPRKQARELIKLERKLEARPTQKASTAPEPIQPLSTGGAKVTKSVVDMSPAEYRQWAAERGM